MNIRKGVTNVKQFFTSVAERLLVAVAIKTELPPSQHERLAKCREELQDYIQREGSPLEGLVDYFYPQGSVAVGATIASRKRENGFDIDVIVELSGRYRPEQALDLLYRAIKGSPGSKYHDNTKKQSRCITVEFPDNMHIDLSPAVLINPEVERLSWIFESKKKAGVLEEKEIIMNSFAFAKYYKVNCPADDQFADAYRRRQQEFEKRMMGLAHDADSVPTPEHTSVKDGKSPVTVALQLLKRFRNIRWLERDERMPASVMLQCLALKFAVPGGTISENLVCIAESILRFLKDAKSMGQLIIVVNPCCDLDIYTDRWPEDMTAQNKFINDMEYFCSQLRIFMDEQQSLADRVKILKNLFGEQVGQEAYVEYMDEMEKPDKPGPVVVSGSVVASESAKAKTAERPQTFYGSEWKK